MKKSIRHLRADSAEWAANDAVIPDGEIALLKTDGGRVKMRVGDGARKFSELPSLDGDVNKSGESAISLSHGVSYRRGELTFLSLAIPKRHDDDFYAEISFDSGDSPTELVISGAPVTFTGDGVADGEFMPDANMHYTMFIWYDGRMQGVVRGAPNA